MYHGSKVIAKNLFRLLPMLAILDFEIIKMPSGCNHYTHLICKLRGIESPKDAKKGLLPGKTRFWKIIGLCHHTIILNCSLGVILQIIFSIIKWKQILIHKVFIWLWIIISLQVISLKDFWLSRSLYPHFNEVEKGYTGFTMSIHPSVHL